MKPRILVTGGTGFIGSALVRSLVAKGKKIRVFDNDSRGAVQRLNDVKNQIEYVLGDIRDANQVRDAMHGVETVFHLAYVNGTEHFYSRPDLVLDVGVKGMINIMDGCEEQGVSELFLASSSEVYQEPPSIPTDESAPLVVPDPRNPRYSYGGGKIISELLAFHCRRTKLQRVIIFRPHNVYGPDMGWEHVVPQFTERIYRAIDKNSPDADAINFPIQGDGSETRSFVYVEDFVNGVLCLLEKGVDGNIYHIGTQNEISIRELALHIGNYFGRKLNVQSGPLQTGSVRRRCPDIRKIQNLGFEPSISIAEGLRQTLDWYTQNLRRRKSA